MPKRNAPQYPLNLTTAMTQVKKKARKVSDNDINPFEPVTIKHSYVTWLEHLGGSPEEIAAARQNPEDLEDKMEIKALSAQHEAYPGNQQINARLVAAVSPVQQSTETNESPSNQQEGPYL